MVSFSLVKLRWKTCFLATSKILGLFFNTLTANGNYCCHKGQIFGRAVQMELLKNRKICYQFFVAFLESTSSFQHFEKKHQPHSSTKSDIIDSKRSFYLNLLNAMF